MPRYRLPRTTVKGDAMRARILAFLRDFAAANGGRGPTPSEISSALLIARATAHFYLRRLVDDGDVEREEARVGYLAADCVRLDSPSNASILTSSNETSATAPERPPTLTQDKES